MLENYRLLCTEEAFDEHFFEPVCELTMESCSRGERFRVALDSETTKVDFQRGFNPFYGVRVAMGSASWDAPGGQGNVAWCNRMRPGLLRLPVHGLSKSKKDAEKRAAFRAALKYWQHTGDLGKLQEDAPWADLEVEEPVNFPVEHAVRRLNALTELGVVWVYKNAKFDVLIYWADGVVVPPLEQIDDVEFWSHLTEQTPWVQGKPVSHKLQDLARRYLKRKTEGSDELEGWFERMGVPQKERCYDAVPCSIAGPYAAWDTRDTLDLLGYFERKAAEMDRESKPGKTLAGMYESELRTMRDLVVETIIPGMRVHQGRADKQLEKHDAALAERNRELFEITGRHVQWDSTDEVEQYLYGPTVEGGLGLKCPDWGLTKKGRRSTNKRVLEALGHPVTEKLLEWRRENTFVSSFLAPIARFNVDGYIHPDFHLTTVRTGRMSCSHPNMQNRPTDADLRAMFIPRDGYVLLLMDLDQIEMRVGAHYAHQVMRAVPDFWRELRWKGRHWKWVHSECKECPLWDGFNSGDRGFDPHQRMVEESGFPRKTMEPGKPSAKTVNFAKMYGAGQKAMMRQFGFDKAGAKRVGEHFARANPELEHLGHFVAKVLEERGWIANEYGRRYYVDRAYLGLNYLVQGCSGDLMKHGLHAVYEIKRELREAHEGPEPMHVDNIVHDEVVMEVREDLLTPALARRINTALVTHERDGEPIFTVPITAGCEVAEHDWGHKREYQMAEVA